MSESTTKLSAEVKAMGAVGDALEGLDEAARQRVLGWAAERFGSQKRADSLDRAQQRTGTSRLSGDEAPGAIAFGRFGSISELFDAAKPDGSSDRALAAAFWFQTVQGSENFAGQQINDELKHMGHGLSNVTRTLSDLASRSPALVQQVQKIGKSKQGRKRYRLTLEGKRRVERLLRGERPSESDD